MIWIYGQISIMYLLISVHMFSLAWAKVFSMVVSFPNCCSCWLSLWDLWIYAWWEPWNIASSSCNDFTSSCNFLIYAPCMDISSIDFTSLSEASEICIGIFVDVDTYVVMIPIRDSASSGIMDSCTFFSFYFMS